MLVVIGKLWAAFGQLLGLDNLSIVSFNDFLHLLDLLKLNPKLFNLLSRDDIKTQNVSLATRLKNSSISELEFLEEFQLEKLNVSGIF